MPLSSSVTRDFVFRVLVPHFYCRRGRGLATVSSWLLYKSKAKVKKEISLDVESGGEDLGFLDLTRLEGHSKPCPLRGLCFSYAWL